jgi:RHS repeat-associated protein
MQQIKFACLFAAMALINVKTFSQIPVPYASTLPINFVRTWSAKVPETNPLSIMQRPVDDIDQSTQYVDGFGRPIQTVAKQQNPNGKDIVQGIVYDQYGREQYQFPVFASTTSNGSLKMDPFQQQTTFYTGYLAGQNQTLFYGHAIFEPSPASRLASQYAPGNNWVGTENQTTEASRHGVDLRYAQNTSVDSVRIWTVTDNGIGNYASYSSPGTYAAGQLSKTITEDEHGGQVIEFMNKDGNLVMKKVMVTALADTGAGKNYSGWLITTYMYDDLNRLRCVLQPRGFELVAAAGMVLTNAQILSQQCFRYEYDIRNRIIMKQAPGAGTVEMVYDMRDRMVMCRDSSLKAQGYWTMNKYDDLNRLIDNALTGNSSTRAAHQTAADGNINYPTLDVVGLLLENYYESYAFTSGITGMANTVSTADFVPNFFFTSGSVNVSPDYAQAMTPDYTNLRNKKTGYKTRVLGTATILYTAIFYNDRGQVLQTRQTNISGGVDITSYQYDFSGKLLRKLLAHQKAGPAARTVRELTKFTYDLAGRQKTIVKKIGLNGTDKAIVSNTYDDAGRLNNKALGTSIETQNYEYNVRGWVLGMNRQWITSGGNHYFGYELGYDNSQSVLSGTYSTPQFNGNISGLVWMSAGDNAGRKYDLKYDPSGRLLKADFNQFTGGSFNRSAGIDYTVTMGDGIHPDSAYDANGNILRMIQNGFKINTSGPLDDMRYTYQTSSNKLAKVTDAVSDPNTKLGDFKDGTNGASDDYAYTANGHLFSDKNKNISSILYTHQNMPYEINITGKGKITYAYDNLGNKLKKQVIDNTVTPVDTTTWLYIQNYIYKDDTLQFFTHEQGRARVDTSAYSSSELTKFDYDYFIKDHLGNIRMVLTDEKDTAIYDPLTFEDLNIARQNALYENKTGQSINVASVRTSKPAGYDTLSSNQKVMMVRKSMGAIGAAKLLKVMSGDRIHTRIDYFYSVTNTDNTSASGINSLLANLATSLVASSQVSAALKDGASALASGLSGNTPFVNLLNTPNATNGSNNAPKAYLNILFFDEQFKPDNAATVVIPVGYSPGIKATINRTLAQAIQARQNGYAYIYFSNESEQMVYFDNFSVTHELSPLREETHYYPFGLTMAAISTKAIGKLNNKLGFNGGSELQNKEFSDGSGLELYDAHFRMQDPQIGRFNQIDPMADLSVGLSPYGFASNNPISRLDPLGMKDTLFHGEIVQRDRDLDLVVVTAARKSPPPVGFYYPSSTREEIDAYRNDKYIYNSRRRGFSVQGGESQSYLSNIGNFKRRYDAEEDGRSMQLFAATMVSAPFVMLAAPVAAPAIGDGLTSELGWKFVQSTAMNLIQNGGDFKKLDLFDISVNTFNPFGGLAKVYTTAGLSSLVDISPLSSPKNRFAIIGAGKNIGQVGLDFGFGVFSGAIGYTFESAQGAATFIEIVTGNVSSATQDLIKDKPE